MAAFPTYTKTFHNTSYPAISPSRPELSLAGKTVLVTGGGSGIGAAITSTFAQAGAARILITGRTVSKLEAVKKTVESSYPSTKVTFHAGDIANSADVAAAFQHLRATFGEDTKVDALIANAGYLSTPEPLSSADPEDWWRGYETNVKGVFNLASQFLKNAAPGASFVNVSTMGAHAGAFANFSGYAGSKIGAAKVVEVLQAENPELRFLNVHPGVIETDMYTKSALGLPTDHIDLSSQFFLWTVSPEAEFLKGKFVWINWDVDELKERKEEITSGSNLTVGLLGWA